MKVDRLERVNQRVLRELGTGLYRIALGENVQTARLSFVSAKVSPDLHAAVVTVSVLGDAAQEAELLDWLRDHRVAFQDHLAKTVGLKYTPVLTFKSTRAIEKGDRVLGILDELAAEEDRPADPPDPPVA